MDDNRVWLTTRYYALRLLAHLPNWTLAASSIFGFFWALIATEEWPFWIRLPMVVVGSIAYGGLAAMLIRKYCAPDKLYPPSKKPEETASLGEFAKVIGWLCGGAVIALTFAERHIWFNRLLVATAIAAGIAISFALGESSGRQKERKMWLRLYPPK